MAISLKNPAVRRVLTIALVLVSVGAAAKLVMEFAGIGGGPDQTSASSASGPLTAAGGRSRMDVAALLGGASSEALLQSKMLKDLNGRPLPDFVRNPFQFGPTPAEVQAQQAAEEREKHPLPPPPPPIPPIPFKAIGYQQYADGQRVACLSDQKDTYVVREGESFGQRFKVLKITDSAVEVQDETYHQVVQLPYPASQ